MNKTITRYYPKSDGIVSSKPNSCYCGNGLLYLITHRLLFLTYSGSLSSMFAKNKRPVLLLTELLDGITRISIVNDKSLIEIYHSIQCSDSSNLDFANPNDSICMGL